MIERRVIGSAPREKDAPSFSYESESRGSGSALAGATRSRAAATSARATARAGLFSSASATRASMPAAVPGSAMVGSAAAATGSAERPATRTPGSRRMSDGRDGDMSTSGRRSSGRPGRDGREHGLPGSQFRKVSRSASLGADRVRGTVRASTSATIRTSTLRSSAAMARSTGGATPTTEARTATGTGVAGETEQPQPPFSDPSRASGQSPCLQQQAAPASAHDVRDAGRKSRPPRSDTATVRTTVAIFEAGARRKLNALKVGRNPYLSRSDFRPLRVSTRPSGGSEFQEALDPARGKSFQK